MAFIPKSTNFIDRYFTVLLERPPFKAACLAGYLTDLQGTNIAMMTSSTADAGIPAL